MVSAFMESECSVGFIFAVNFFGLFVILCYLCVCVCVCVCASMYNVLLLFCIAFAGLVL